MKVSYRITAGLFLAFLSCAAVVNLALPDRSYSESEKRELQAFPSWSVARTLDGVFMKEFDSYANDQFFGRDAWVQAKGMSQYLAGQRLIHDVYLAGGRYMGNFKLEDEKRFTDNLAAIRRLAEKSPLPVSLLIAPEEVGIYSDLLPSFAQTEDQDALAARIARELGDRVTVVWTKSALSPHREEEIYFRTDHHWTPRGALYGYNAWRRALGKTERPMPEFETVSRNFRGSMLFKAGIRLPWLPEDTLTIPKGITNEQFSVVINDGKTERDGLMFDFSYLNGEDQYRIYQGGNQPLMAISSATGRGRALVLKDSFCNVLLPYLASDYETVYVADMRYNRQSPAQYAADMGVDEIVLVYSMSSICDEFSLAWLAN